MTDYSLKPIHGFKDGPGFDAKDVIRLCLGAMKANDYFSSRSKKMNEDLQQATDDVNKWIDNLDKGIDKIVETEARVAQKAKNAASSIKNTAEKLGQSLHKIERQADFSKLEKQIELIERATAAFNTLAELEQSGTLDKVINAIRN